METKKVAESSRRIRRESYYGYLVPLLAEEASVHGQGNSHACVGVSIRPVGRIALGEGVHRHSVSSRSCAVVRWRWCYDGAAAAATRNYGSNENQSSN